VTATLVVDPATMLDLERHETLAHSIPSREVRDQRDALVLYDPHDRDPFWNRMVRVRWPSDAGAFDRRLAEALTFFALVDRVPHVWPSPLHGEPADLVARLEANGFRDVGGGHVMVHAEPAKLRAVEPDAAPSGVALTTIVTPRDAGPRDVLDIARVLAEAFGAAPGREAELAGDLERTLGDPRIVLVLARVDGEPAAVAKASTFDGLTYLSSIGTRSAYRGRGLARLVTRHAVAVGGGAGSRLAYLGVFSGNVAALRLYEGLGFRSIGESPDLLLE